MAKKILIVDDESDLVETLTFRLEASGYDIVSAHDGQEGLEKARSEKPDLILLDVMMPKVNGFQVCRELKNDEKTKGIKIVILTAKSQESDKFWGKNVGADGYISKPFEASELLAKIEELLAE